MSSNYMILYTSKRNEKYFIIEETTQQTITSFKTVKEAKNYLNFLNKGGFFDGWTPAFFLKNNVKNANQSF